MKMRNFGLAGGLVAGGTIMGAGLFLMALGDTKPGGNGLMLVLGGLVFVPGAIITIVTFVSWSFASVYSTLDPGKQRIFWGVAMAILAGTIGVVKVNSYLASQPEAIAKRELEETAKAEANAMREAAGEKAAMEKLHAVEAECQKAQALILGKWAFEGTPDYYAEYDENHIMYYTDGRNWRSEGRWGLRCTNRPSEPLTLLLSESIQTCAHCASTGRDHDVLNLDSTKLIAIDRYSNKAVTRLRVGEVANEHAPQ